MNTAIHDRPNSSADQKVQAGGKLETIQFLRAIAVLAVLVSHAMWEVRELVAPLGISVRDKLFPGDFGVDLFFVISGFIMVYATRNMGAGAGNAFDFMKRRIIRIVPLYWITTTAMIAVLIAMPDAVQTATREPVQWLQSYLFIPFERAHDGLARPVLGLGWSLNYEMFFYLIFALGLFLPRILGLFFTVIAISVFAIGGQFGMFQGAAFGFLSQSVILEFAFGIVLGWLYLSDIRISRLSGAAAVIGGGVLLYLAPAYSDAMADNRHLTYGVPALLFVMAAVMTSGADIMRMSRASLVMGEISYSTYLTHSFVLGALAIIWSKTALVATLTTWTGLLAFLGTAIVLSLIVAWFTHYLLDKPLTDWLNRVSSKRPSTIPSRNSAILA